MAGGFLMEGSRHTIFPFPFPFQQEILLFRGQPIVAYRPDQAHHLLLKIKFYWTTATPICLCIVYDCFHAITAESNGCDRDRMAHRAEKYLLSGPLGKNFAKPWSRWKYRCI